MNATRRAFRRQAVGFLIFYAGIVLVLNHAMLTQDWDATRGWFYILVVFVPLGLFGITRVLRRTHRGEDEDDAKEGLILFSFGAAVLGALWLVSTALYTAPETTLSAEDQALIDKYTEN